ncbi:hypothetical protein IAT38_005066 [Cryptococcus sp. DSM 104549]
MPPQSHHHHSGQRYGSIGHQGGMRGAKPLNKLEIESLPSMDSAAYYAPPDSPSSSTGSTSPLPHHHLLSNSGNKLEPGAQFMRHGKMYAWGPSYEAATSGAHARTRLKLCLEQIMPVAAADVGAPPPANIVKAASTRKERKRKRDEENEFVLPHLRSPSPPMSNAKIGSMLALPQTYTDVLENPAMRHSLGSDILDEGLQRTAGELLEGEKPLMQALGRLKDVVRLLDRDVKPLPPSAPVNGSTNGDEIPPLPEYTYPPPPNPNHIPPLPHISDQDNLFRVTSELLAGPGQSQAAPPPTLFYTLTAPGTAAPSRELVPEPEPVPTAFQRLFVRQGGITLNAEPNPGHPGFQYQPGHSHYPQTMKYNLDLAAQCNAVDDAWERINELLADCNEYRERLWEARDRVADVTRVRKRVWRTVKERAAAELEKKERERK